jgi:hypothetical protein
MRWAGENLLIEETSGNYHAEETLIKVLSGRKSFPAKAQRRKANPNGLLCVFAPLRETLIA